LYIREIKDSNKAATLINDTIKNNDLLIILDINDDIRITVNTVAVDDKICK
jgi:hypothetical protein